MIERVEITNNIISKTGVRFSSLNNGFIARKRYLNIPMEIIIEPNAKVKSIGLNCIPGKRFNAGNREPIIIISVPVPRAMACPRY